MSIGGSSPLTRGKRHALPRQRHRHGLIPAHAGKTDAVETIPATLRAHPRSRGENGKTQIGSHAPLGSSPLTRGKHRCSSSLWRTRGLIPAHAGKTRTRPPRSRTPRAHPRSRGENGIQARFSGRWTGSSPLTRGKPRVHLGAVQNRGLIPAHAGKTDGRGKRAQTGRAHPRSRGENIGLSAPPCWVTGSSPLTRGKPGRRARVEDLRGLIPAHAGKTTWALLGRARRRAHPRSRGENNQARS